MVQMTKLVFLLTNKLFKENFDQHHHAYCEL